MLDPLLLAAAVVVLAGLAGIFVLSLAEAALLAVSSAGLRTHTDADDRRARVVEELRSGNGEYLSAIIASITLLIVLVSSVATGAVLHVAREAARGAESLWVTTASVIMVAFILIFCELAPKSFAKQRPLQAALALAPTVRALTKTAGPAVRVLTAIASAVLRIFGLRTTHRRRFLTEADIAAAAEVGEEEGTVEPREREMIENIIEFGTQAVREVMVPRVDIVAVPAEATPDDVLDLAQETGFSRIPVYRDTIDDIIGIVYVNDLLAHLSNGDSAVRLLDLVREPLHVPETKKVDELFREFQRKHVHLAIVLDEYGGTEGLVTIEDILEEIVGEILDEHDRAAAEIRPLSDTEFLVDGGVAVDDLNQRLGLSIPEGDYHTIGGFVFARVGEVPDVGERIVLPEAEVIVEACDGQRINEVRVIRSAGHVAEVRGEE